MFKMNTFCKRLQPSTLQSNAKKTKNPLEMIFHEAGIEAALPV
jgi:hypothetical protein